MLAAESARGSAISSAERYCEETSPRTRTLAPRLILPARIASGGNPSFPGYSIAAPRRRSASTRSPIGRLCIRGVPERTYSPPANASTAVSGRNAVPALLKRSSADLTGKFPPTPCTTAESSGCRSILTPRRASASSMTRVSSASRRSLTRVSPRESAARRSTRFEMLFEPGIFTVPATRAIGSRSRNFTLRAPSGGQRVGGLFPLLGQGGVARAARRGGRPSFAATPPRRLRRHPPSKEEGKIQAPRSFPVLQPAVARIARAGEKRVQRLRVAALDYSAHPFELSLVTAVLGVEGVLVGNADIAPHFRVAPGDAGEIAESPRRIGKQLLRVLLARNLVDERVGEHVRQRADGRQHRLAFTRLQVEHPRAAGFPSRARQSECIRIGSFELRQHHPAPAVESGKRAFSAALFGACDRVTRHETRKRAL